MRSRVDQRLVGWMLLGGSLLGLALWVSGFRASMAEVLQNPVVPSLEAYLAGLAPERATWLTEWNGGRWGHYGWYLRSGETGRLAIQLPGDEAGIVKLKMTGSELDGLHMEIRSRGVSQLIKPSTVLGDVVSVHVAGPSNLFVTASNLEGRERLVLESILAAWYPPSQALPCTWPFSLLLGMGQVGLLCLATQGNARGTGLVSRTPDGRYSIYAGCFSLFLAAAVGFYLRWEQFDLARGLVLPPDVLETWWPFARKFELFSDTSGLYSGAFREREPLYVAMLHYWLRLWGDTAPSVRLLSLCLSGVLVASIGYFIWGVTGRWWVGTVAAWLVAFNQEWIDLSVQGMRDESTALLFLAFLSVWLWAKGWRGAVLMGLTMGILWLTRAPLVSVTLPLMWGICLLNVWRAKKSRPLAVPGGWTWKQLATASCLAIALYGPYLLGVARIHGDLSWQSSWQARWNANVEFQDRLGTAGWPTRSEFERNAYAGPPISYSQYLFGLHPLSDIVFGQVKGWAAAMIYMAASPEPDKRFIARLFVARGVDALPENVSIRTLLGFGVLTVTLLGGWMALLRNPVYQWIPILCLWGMWYAAFMYGLRLIEPFRQTCHVYPLLLICQMWGLVMVSAWATTWREGGDSIPQASMLNQSQHEAGHRRLGTITHVGGN